VKERNGTDQRVQYAVDSDKRPTGPVINPALPGKGKVWIGTPALVQYREGEDPLASPGSWRSDREPGWAGAIAGSGLDLPGALAGALGSLGCARSLVLGLMAAVSVAGAIGAGVFAWVRGQPYVVCYPLLLGGGVAVLVFGGLIPTGRRRCARTELRRMAAAFGCNREELAVTRNTTGALEIVQFGMELKPGNEILTTTQDYPSMMTTWHLRQ
jgi:hypothetical protein